MEKMGRQTFAGYQMQSLIEFLLRDGTRPGWLDRQSHNQSSQLEAASRNEFTLRVTPGSAAA